MLFPPKEFPEKVLIFKFCKKLQPATDTCVLMKLLESWSPVIVPVAASSVLAACALGKILWWLYSMWAGCCALELNLWEWIHGKHMNDFYLSSQWMQMKCFYWTTSSRLLWVAGILYFTGKKCFFNSWSLLIKARLPHHIDFSYRGPRGKGRTSNTVRKQLSVHIAWWRDNISDFVLKHDVSCNWLFSGSACSCFKRNCACNRILRETQLHMVDFMSATAAFICFCGFSSRSPTVFTKELSHWQSQICHDSEENSSIYVLSKWVSPWTACHNCHRSVVIEKTVS